MFWASETESITFFDLHIWLQFWISSTALEARMFAKVHRTYIQMPCKDVHAKDALALAGCSPFAAAQ